MTARRFLELKHLRLVQRDCKAKTESTTSAIIVEIASLAPNIFFFKVVTCYFWLLLATGSHRKLRAFGTNEYPSMPFLLEKAPVWMHAQLNRSTLR